METHTRSLLKALSWRIIALVITTVVSYLLSKSVTVAVTIGLLDSAIKIGAYYFHERAWMQVRFGIKPVAAAPAGGAEFESPELERAA